VRASENRKALEDKVGSLKGTVERAEQTIALLHSKAQKLEDSLANARQVAAQRHNHLKKLQSGVHQYKTCFERLASSEKEIKALATATLDTEGHGMRVDDEEGDALFTNGGVRASGEVGAAA
jgi:ABC-type transporter Mla subunit MlaD